MTSDAVELATKAILVPSGDQAGFPATEDSVNSVGARPLDAPTYIPRSVPHAMDFPSGDQTGAAAGAPIQVVPSLESDVM